MVRLRVVAVPRVLRVAQAVNATPAAASHVARRWIESPSVKNVKVG